MSAHCADLNQRLDRIEATMATMVTHDELVRGVASIATNINDLRNEVRQVRLIVQQIAGSLGALPNTLQLLGERFTDVTDRVRRLEERDRDSKT